MYELVNKFRTKIYMRDFRLPLRCSCGLRSSGMLRCLSWHLVTDVSGQHTGPILKGKAVPEAFFFDWLILEDGLDKLSRNVGNGLTTYVA
jgi:hypothetical protein